MVRSPGKNHKRKGGTRWRLLTLDCGSPQTNLIRNRDVTGIARVAVDPRDATELLDSAVLQIPNTIYCLI
jgi:hypothetical protein